MPLTAVNFVPLTGNIKAADLHQFFDLFTGAMTDQPVTFANTLTVGGSQGAGAAPFRIGGVAAQAANMVEVRKLAADAQPEFVIGPTGTLAWGPGGAVGTDVSLARSAANQLTLTGLAGTPALVIPVGGLQVAAGNVGIGGVPLSSNGLFIPVTYSLNASGGSAIGLNMSGTLVAQVNGDGLYGAYISPTFNDNGKTGVAHLGAFISGGLQVTGGALVDSLKGPGVVASAGSIRLSNGTTGNIEWRNGANNGDLIIGADGSNQLQLSSTGVGGWNTDAASPAAGAGGAPPAAPATYLRAVVNGVVYKSPLYTNS